MTGLPAAVPAPVLLGRPVGPGHAPLVVAELSGNHNGDPGRALKLLDAAAAAGADAVKLQTYRAESLTIDHDGPGFVIGQGPWKGRTLYGLYQEAAMPMEWHQPLFARGRELGIPVFSTPFDEEAVDFLASAGVPAYKIASFELCDTRLISRAARQGKPLVISTGLGSSSEISRALGAAAAAPLVVLLHCVSAYPAPLSACNLRRIPGMARRFGVPCGLSDHTTGVAAAAGAVALGAVMIEKHITLARADGGPDAAFSLEPDELATLVRTCREVFLALGEDCEERHPEEEKYRQFRRSLYVIRDVPGGSPIRREDVGIIRPGHGLAPHRLDEVVGRRALRTLRRGEPVLPDMFAPGGTDGQPAENS